MWWFSKKKPEPKPQPLEYMVDWDKVKTIKDIKLILEGVYGERLFISEDYGKFDELSHLLKDEPRKVNNDI